MSFNSISGAEAGRKSKRGKNENIAKMRERLLSLSDDLLKQIENDNLNTSDKIKLLQIVLQYSLPRLKVLEIDNISNLNDFRPVEIIFNKDDNKQ